MQKEQINVDPLKELSHADMLRILEEEATRLNQVEQIILNHLHSLQVEEELIMRMLKAEACEKQREASNTNNEEATPDAEGTMDDLDMELEAALKVTLPSKKKRSKKKKSSLKLIDEQC